MNHQKSFSRHTLTTALAAFTLGISGLGLSTAAFSQDQSAPKGGEAPEGAPQSTSGQKPDANAPSAIGGSQSAGAPFITEQKSSQTLASSVMGMSIHNGTGKEAKDIGKVTDLILDGDHKLAGVVVGVGGFLGIGQKDVGIPWDKVAQINPETHVAIVNMSKEALEKAPPFTSTEEKKVEKQQEKEQEKMKTRQSQPSGGIVPMPAPAPAPSGS
ncbi:MAG: PRC-barrel domain containing protein [Castellaniella sp.]|uniref:PRC-barrel domain-containing protein n=1 Tax=Castellaniella sp. TaxID=1955812 RepID=UPI001211747A|nr:PRC-barrel domain-containing protein [Castellaniella sp.]TAN30547.1 MAG: PRC-barrel domain containing protein [Castellaniella sp.]